VIIAIAVSGGVDSMALAYLCRKLQEEQPSRFHFKAFVVNHMARENSTEEAKSVALSLRSLGGFSQPSRARHQDLMFEQGFQR